MYVGVMSWIEVETVSCKVIAQKIWLGERRIVNKRNKVAIKKKKKC